MTIDEVKTLLKTLTARGVLAKPANEFEATERVKDWAYWLARYPAVNVSGAVMKARAENPNGYLKPEAVARILARRAVELCANGHGNYVANDCPGCKQAKALERDVPTILSGKTMTPVEKGAGVARLREIASRAVGREE
jgi:hypothetical protein